MRFDIWSLPRAADQVDLSGATTAKRTGPAWFGADGRLEIPFDRTLTTTEVAAVTKLLTAPSDAVATWRGQVQDYLAVTTPTTAQNTAAIKNLARLLLDVLDRQQ